MARVTVPLSDRSYDVLIGRGAIMELPALVRRLAPTGIALITSSDIARHWSEPVVQALTGAGFPCPVLEVGPGGSASETTKGMPALERSLAFLEGERIDRRGLVIALGGGVVGDLAGFAAAVWMRGVRYLQIPTTLLAMVDSSVGGKTAVNSPRSKNSIGAFWQPAAVIADLATLGTLAPDEVTSGFGEVCKYGLSLDEPLARTLEDQTGALTALDLEALEPVVARCVELKAEVVRLDEREGGARAVLNYGHTVGHAIEAASGFAAAHGRAISQGMRVAARLGVAQRLCGEEVVDVTDRLLEAYGLPGPLPEVEVGAVLDAVTRDKKASGGRVAWVLPRRLGRAQVGVKVPDATVERVVSEVLG